MPYATNQVSSAKSHIQSALWDVINALTAIRTITDGTADEIDFSKEYMAIIADTEDELTAIKRKLQQRYDEL